MSKVKKAVHIGKNGIVAVIGFILSPLSWWNDLFVNVPLSLLFAWISGKLLLPFMDITKPAFIFLFILGYWISNIVGMVMMEKGVRNIIANKASRRSTAINALITVAYSIAITVIMYSDYNSILTTLHIIPDWVK